MEFSLLPKLFFWLIVLIASVYYFIFGLIYILKVRKYIRTNGELAVAEIVDCKISKDSDGGNLYCPVLEITNKSGNKITFEIDIEDGSYTKYKIGSTLNIYYLPDKPENFYVVGIAPQQVYLLIIGVPTIIGVLYMLVDTILSF